MDYFRCEPLDLNQRLFVIGGFWPLETNRKWKQVVFSIFSFLCYFSLTSMVAIQMADLYLLRHDLVKLTKDLSLISMSTGITIKSLFILYKVYPINELRAELAKYKASRVDPEEVEILEKSNERILRVIKLFYVLTTSVVFFWILYPALDTAPGHRVPFPYILPVEEWTTTIHVIVYVYHSLAMIGFAINYVSVDCLFCGILLRIDAHYDIIIKKMKILGEETTKDRTQIKKVVRETIVLHQKVLSEIKTIGNIFSPSTAAHFGGIVPVIGIAIIDIMGITKGFRLQIFQKMLYVGTGLFDTFLYCFFAHKIQEKSLELSFAAYDSRWYEMSLGPRRDLLFISSRSQKTPKIKVASLFALDMKAFVSIVKISYDITALLFQTVRE